MCFRSPTLAFAPRLVERVEAIAGELGFSVRRLPSGAGHDAQVMAAVCPACMIFVPSVGGISHNVEEYTEAADQAVAIDWRLAHIGCPPSTTRSCPVICRPPSPLRKTTIAAMSSGVETRCSA